MNYGFFLTGYTNEVVVDFDKDLYFIGMVLILDSTLAIYVLVLTPGIEDTVESVLDVLTDFDLFEVLEVKVEKNVFLRGFNINLPRNGLKGIGHVYIGGVLEKKNKENVFVLTGHVL